MLKSVPFGSHDVCACVSSCEERTLTVLAAYRCDHSHQQGSQTKQTGFYTRQFASVMVEAWYPQKWFQHVPNLSTSSALKGNQSHQAEAEDLRANGTWGGSTGIPVAELRKRARAKGKDIKIAEVFAGIQRRELSPELQKYKRRIVYRGDMIKDQFNQHVFFTEAETATTPTMLAALNLTLWFGCLTMISCAHCVQAYLQCLLEGNTWVILPFELWLEEWKKTYDPSTRLAKKLIKSLVVWSSTIRKVVGSPSRKAVNWNERSPSWIIPFKLCLETGKEWWRYISPEFLRRWPDTSWGY